MTLDRRTSTRLTYLGATLTLAGVVFIVLLVPLTQPVTQVGDQVLSAAGWVVLRLAVLVSIAGTALAGVGLWGARRAAAVTSRAPAAR